MRGGFDIVLVKIRKVGFDIRPALFNFAGIGRYVRELGVALTQLEDGPFMEMFAPSWRGGRSVPKELVAGRHHMNRGFLPGRVMSQLHKLPKMDAGRFPAKVDVFHWTDFSCPTVRSCATVMTLHDAAFAVNPTFHGWETSNLLDRVRHMLNKAEIVIVPSQPSCNDAELMGVEPDQVRVIPHGVAHPGGHRNRHIPHLVGFPTPEMHDRMGKRAGECVRLRSWQRD